MLRWLFGKKTNEPAGGQGPVLRSDAAAASELQWVKDATLPIPDWPRQAWPPTTDDEALHRHANALAGAWVDAVAGALTPDYGRVESANFMLLSALPPRERQVLLDYLERSRRRVLGTLPGISPGTGHGKSVVMVFAAEDVYYQYISNYTRPSSEPEGFSGGMFIDAGYGHFVFAGGTFERMEPVVVHELTHCLVRHLPIPAWLNEGLAVNTELRFAGRPPRYRANELQYLFGQFWNAATVQEFWSGKSFVRADDGQALSYELARHLVQLLDKDYELLVRYCNEASSADGGEAAACRVLGTSLEDVLAIILGPGAWKPDPSRWKDGIEKGQFQGLSAR